MGMVEENLSAIQKLAKIFMHVGRCKPKGGSVSKCG
jgi:hypothetical protein